MASATLAMQSALPALILVAGGLATAGVTFAATQQPAKWSVEAKPTLTLGESEADTNDMFSQVVGATRLPNGQVLTGDVGSFALRLFAADGKLVRRFGRKGAGPGEIGHLKGLLRCGDSIVTMDIEAQRTSVFTLGGTYVRSFRFASPQPARPPYASACNGAGDFVHFGWENQTDMIGGAYRGKVPLWLSKTDSSVRQLIATIPGSERYGLVADGQLRGSRPLPLGKQTAIALGKDRVYVAVGDQYEIQVFDLAGKTLPPIRDGRAVVATTRADIDRARDLELALVAEPQRAAAVARFDAMPFPKTLPSYRSLRVDVDGNVWAQDYPRQASQTSQWTVFDAGGRRIAEAALPVHLDVYEIGRDYVLARYLDPDESVPQVRMYRLKRGT